MLQGGAETGFAKIEQDNPWLASTPLVVKPDQLIKRRGKAGLLAVNKTWPEVQAWISERMGKSQEVCMSIVPMIHHLCLVFELHCYTFWHKGSSTLLLYARYSVFGTNCDRSSKCSRW